MDWARVDVVGLTQALVSAPGESGDEKAAADVAIIAMEVLGFREIVRDAYGSVVGLLGPANADVALLLDGHLDVVPVTADWTVDPFGGEITGGRLYGRGSTDMKGAVAAAICGAALAADAGTLSRQVAVSASVMEEILEGVALAKILDEHNPEAVVICEPSRLEIMTAQRGRLELVLTLRGVPAHASSPDLGKNPIGMAAYVLELLKQIRFRNDPVLGTGVLVPVSIVSDPLPSPSMIPATVTINFDRRTVPGETRESVFQEIRTLLVENGINDFTLECHAAPVTTYTGVGLCPDRDFPSWAIPTEHPIVVAGLSALKASGLPEKVGVWNCCTNGSESAGRRKIPTIGVGPGDIRDAHIVDESIEISQLTKAVDVYKNIVLALCE